MEQLVNNGFGPEPVRLGEQPTVERHPAPRGAATPPRLEVSEVYLSRLDTDALGPGLNLGLELHDRGPVGGWSQGALRFSTLSSQFATSAM